MMRTYATHGKFHITVKLPWKRNFESELHLRGMKICEFTLYVNVFCCVIVYRTDGKPITTQNYSRTMICIRPNKPLGHLRGVMYRPMKTDVGGVKSHEYVYHTLKHKCPLPLKAQLMHPIYKCCISKKNICFCEECLCISEIVCPQICFSNVHFHVRFPML